MLRITTILLVTTLIALFSMSEADAHEIYESYPNGSCDSEYGYEAVCGLSSSAAASQGTQGGDVEAYILSVFGADGPTAVAVATCESGLDPSAYNPSGASGVFQIMPATALAVGTDPALLFDWEVNVDTAYRLYQEQGWAPWVCAA